MTISTYFNRTVLFFCKHVLMYLILKAFQINIIIVVLLQLYCYIVYVTVYYILTQGGFAFSPQLCVTRFLHVLVAEYLLQRTYDEHLFGVGPLDHVNRPRAGTRPPSVLCPRRLSGL